MLNYKLNIVGLFFLLLLSSQCEACVPSDIPFADARLNKIRLSMRPSAAEKVVGERFSVKGDTALIFDTAAKNDRETKLMPGIVQLDSSGKIRKIAGRASSSSRQAALEWLAKYGKPIALTDASKLKLPHFQDLSSEQFALCVAHDISLEVVFIKKIYLAEPDIPYFNLTNHNESGGCYQQLK
jgi:hypothetical protein